MSASDTLDFDKLLAPISAAAPTGIDLRIDTSPRSLYRQIREARDEAQAAERKLFTAPKADDGKDAREVGGDVQIQPDWGKVFDKAVQALADQTKDLQIAVFLTEALVRQQGLAGLADGFRLLREFCERFWDPLYPLATGEDGLSGRLKPLLDLNDAERMIVLPIARLPITEAASAGGPFDCGHYKQALVLSQKEESIRAERIRGGAVSLEQLREVARASSGDFYRRASQDHLRCSEELVKLGAILDQKGGKDSPPTRKIQEALTLYGEALKELAGDRLSAQAPAPSPESASSAPGDLKNASTTAHLSTLTMRTREEAFETLLKVADFFRRTEPHTPVSYKLEEAVRWGRMNLRDLFTDLIQDEGLLKQVFLRVGIRPPGSA